MNAQVNALPAPDVERFYLAILSTPIPPVINPTIRRQHRKFWAASIRNLFKQLGIKGISVTTPKYSMAHSVDIQLPSTRDVTAHDKYEHDFLYHEASQCRYCSTRHEACKRIERIILAAFPDLDDRSESMTDHFDFCLSIQ